MTADSLTYPTRRDEAWRYAPHRTLEALVFGPPAGVPTGAAEIIEQLPELGGPRIVVVNGVVAELELPGLGGTSGLHLSTLAEALEQGAELVSSHVGIDEPADAFVALNLEHGADGAVIDVAEGAAIEQPIHIVDVAIPDAVGSTSSSGVVIRLGAGSSATVVESRVGAGAQLGGSNVRTTVTLGQGATLDHVVLQDLPADQVHLGRVDVDQAAGSTFRARAINVGAAYGRLSYAVELQGTEAVADLAGLYYGVGDQTLDQQIMIVHAAADCTSRQAFRGVLDDESTGVFSGGIDVHVGADGTDASQANDNLLLSNRAEVNTQPRLEILADEVSCAHGATVGQLDDAALYYMRSRGIGADQARQILVNGFSDQIVDEIAIPEVRSWVIQRLGHGDDA